MNFIAKVIHDRKRLLKFYGLVMILGILMIALRKVLDFRAGYTFLLWNTFLALVPLALSSIMLEMNQRNYRKRVMLITGFFWLLFLPNAPYLLTDYKYVWNDSSGYIYQNITCLSWFIVPGFLAAIISLNDISEILSARFSRKTVAIQLFLICMVSGFGVLIGIMRFNSWDVLHRPLSIFEMIGRTLLHPLSNWLNWMSAFGYGMVLYMCYQLIKLISQEFRRMDS